MQNPFSKIPNGARSILLVMGAVGPIMMLVGNAVPELRSLWIPAYITLGAIAALASVVHYRGNKQKAKKFEEGIDSEARKDPTGQVKDAQEFANVDHLKQEFQRGVEIYRTYGKDLYSLPWYVVVGEPGAGKSEAIRNSEIKFPPNLHNLRQGVGGTYSMHWWFTDFGVILDTAGSLFFDSPDDDRGRTGWVSFLKMLKKQRPDCPINGLLLVIPADSLLADGAGQVERKAGVIAGQLETIQRELKIRFPVYAVITKTDRIPGFREFFEPIAQSSKRYQMVGWSNPEPLEKPFRPDLVDRHIGEIVERFEKRRRTYLKDPVPRNPENKRADEVDGMYSLPDSLESLTPNLRRYLEVIFVKDTWSMKPPYLRGIYFTSALQEGSVLDSSLAKALGMEISDQVAGDPADEGESDRNGAAGAFQRNHAYFIRDLFLNKIFKERGLVTTQIPKKKKERKSPWAITGIIGGILVAILVALTLVAGKRAKDEEALWSKIADSKPEPKTNRGMYIVPVVADYYAKGDWAYIGNRTVGGEKGDFEKTRLDDLVALQELTGRNAKMGWVFAPAQAASGMSGRRKETFRMVVNQSLIQPLIEASLYRLREEVEVGGDTGENNRKKSRDKAVVALVKFYLESLDGTRDEPVTVDLLKSDFLDPLLGCAAPDYSVGTGDMGKLAGLLKETYDGKSGGRRWPPANQVAWDPVGDAVGKILQVSTETQENQAERDEKLKLALEQFDRAVTTRFEADGDLDERFKQFETAYSVLDDYSGMVENLIKQQGSEPGESEAQREEEQGDRATVRREIEDFLGTFGPANPEVMETREVKKLVRILANSEAASRQVGRNQDDEIDSDLIERYLVPADNRRIPPYRRIYELVYDSKNPFGEEGIRGVRTTETAEQVAGDLDSLRARIQQATSDELREYCELLLERGIREQAHEFVDKWLKFPLVNEATSYRRSSDELDIALKLLPVFAKDAAFKDVMTVRRALFDDSGLCLNWEVLLGKDTYKLSFVRFLRLESMIGKDVDDSMRYLSDSDWRTVTLRTDADLRVTLYDAEQNVLGSPFGRLGDNETWGMLKLLLRDTEITPYAPFGGRADRLEIGLSGPKVDGTQDTNVFKLRFESPNEHTILSRNDWPTKESIRKKLPAGSAPGESGISSARD